MRRIRIGAATFAFCIILSGCAANQDGNVTRGLSKDSQNAMDLGATEVIAADQSGFGQMLASFTTNYNEGSKGRAHNIKLAAKSINGKIVQPNDIFSYNDAVGPTNSRRGYKKAKVFLDGKEKEGFGGGVCQVSSTLYNAVEKAGLEVVERHEHSKKVYYVKPDRDAATSYGSVDFKFKNTKDIPVIIKSSAGEGRLTVDICAA